MHFSVGKNKRGYGNGNVYTLHLQSRMSRMLRHMILTIIAEVRLVPPNLYEPHYVTGREIHSSLTFPT